MSKVIISHINFTAYIFYTILPALFDYKREISSPSLSLNLEMLNS